VRLRRADTYSLAGWLFADLLLALAVLLAASSGFGIARAAAASTTPTPTPSVSRPSSTATSSPSPTPSQASIALNSICRHVNVRGSGLLANDKAAISDAVAAVAQTFGDLANLRGALVLTFGTASTPTRAHDLAHALNALLKSDLVSGRVGSLFQSAETRDYILLNSDPRLDGEMWLELYLPPPVPLGAKTEDGCPR